MEGTVVVFQFFILIFAKLLKNIVYNMYIFSSSFLS